MTTRVRALTVLVLAGVLHPAVSAEPTPAQAEFFKGKVLPVLESTCFKCHSHAGKKNKGGLVVDSLAGLIQGGDTGPAIVPGKPEESLLVKVLRHDDDIRMPPSGKLPADQIAILAEWVKQGAPWPGGQSATAKHVPGKITAEDRRFWAFQPVKAPAIPTIQDPEWAQNPIDRFILDRLNKEGLTPTPLAEPRALVRRLYFDLVGLPPTPAEAEDFVQAFQTHPQSALTACVDRLLASPRYGEKWARHWLDLVRYAESDGYRADEFRPTAWRYRDYVVRAFNQDKPYNQFLREQIAGDEIIPHDPDALAATGYLRLWIYEFNQRDVRTQWQGILDDITDVTGEAILGLGIGCAKCHDHKFDPILQKDYFRLQAYFAALLPRDESPLASPDAIRAHQGNMTEWEKQTASLRQELNALLLPDMKRAEAEAIKRFPPDIQDIMHKPEVQRTPLEKQLHAVAYRQVAFEFDRLDKKLKDTKKEKYLALKDALAKFDHLKPAALPVGMTVRDVGPTAPETIVPKKKIAVDPGILTIFDDKPAQVTLPQEGTSTGRRTALADWLTQPDHPLTTRVIVNRVWQQHFGQGLVSTSSDFGRLGEKPTHPELLDWLASDFVERGWSLKNLHRQIVTSRTYLQSATHPPSALAIKNDPQNRLLSRMPVRRLQAEQIRDAVLAVTGRLDLNASGPSVDLTQPRRTIFTKAMRNTRDPLLDVFDAPEGISSVGQRNVTTTPTQALLLINGNAMIGHAQTLAARLQATKTGTDPDKIDHAFRLVFGRPPSSREREAALAFVGKQKGRVDPKVSAPVFQYAQMPFREGRAVLMRPEDRPRLQLADDSRLPPGDFSLEAYVVLKSIYEDGRVRPIAAHGQADIGPGWLFGVTSKKSAFKPQNLVLQMWGENEKGTKDYEPVFSNLHIELNRPYFVAVSVKMSDTGKQGLTFFARDLSNDEEPLQIDNVGHKVVKFPPARGPFQLGGVQAKSDRAWDGLLDDVRLSRGALTTEQLLLSTEGVAKETVAFWRFEPTPGAFKDTSSNNNDLVGPQAPISRTEGSTSAWVDFCHVLLNANEFLYID